MAKILLIEDDRFFAAELRAWLTKEKFVVDHSESGEDGLYRLKHFDYDMAVVDWMLPDFEGVQICRQIRQLKEHLPLLMLTSRRDIADKVEGLDSGAMDYLVKPCALPELSARIRALLRRHAAPVVSRIIVHDLELEPDNNRCHCNGADIKLTPIEYELLLQLARAGEQELSNKVLAEKIGERRPEFTGTAVRSHIWKLRQRLQSAGSNTSVVYRSGFGYCLCPANENDKAGGGEIDDNGNDEIDDE